MSCDVKKEQLRMYSMQCHDTQETERIEQHLEHCQECAAVVSGYKTSNDLLVEAFDEEAPDWLLEKTMANVRARTERHFVWGIPLLAGSMMVLLLLVFTLKIHRKNVVAPPSLQEAHQAELPLDESNGNYQKSLLNDLLAEGFEGDNENPVDDRSIYESLDIASEVAKLLL